MDIPGTVGLAHGWVRARLLVWKLRDGSQNSEAGLPTALVYILHTNANPARCQRSHERRNGGLDWQKTDWKLETGRAEHLLVEWNRTRMPACNESRGSEGAYVVGLVLHVPPVTTGLHWVGVRSFVPYINVTISMYPPGDARRLSDI